MTVFYLMRDGAVQGWTRTKKFAERVRIPGEVIMQGLRHATD